MVDLGSFGGAETSAFAINDQGTIVGEGQTASGSFHAFLSDGKGLADLNSLIAPIPGFTLVSATGINASGQIAAYGRFASDPSYLIHEVLLSPTGLGVPTIDPSPSTDPGPSTPPPVVASTVPEPASVAVFALIAAAAATRRRIGRPRA